MRWRLSHDALNLLNEYEIALDRRGIAYPGLDKWFARMLWVSVKIALLMAAMRRVVLTFPAEGDTDALSNPVHVWDGEIELAELAYGIWFVERTMRGGANILARLGTSEEERELQRILGAIRESGAAGITRKTLGDNRNIDPDYLTAVIDGLAARGDIVVEKKGKGRTYYARDQVEKNK